MRLARDVAGFFAALLIVAFGSVVLTLLGRPLAEVRRVELDVDPEIDHDDAGADVDEDERHL